jgi:hypothetical protein
MERNKRRRSRAALLGALAAAVALALAPSASAKTEKVTGNVKVDQNHSEKGGFKVVIGLQRGRKTVGSLHFPGCGSGGLSTICGGALNLNGVGRGLSVLFTWNCHVKNGGGTACAKSARSPITDSPERPAVP